MNPQCCFQRKHKSQDRVSPQRPRFPKILVGRRQGLAPAHFTGTTSDRREQPELQYDSKDTLSARMLFHPQGHPLNHGTAESTSGSPRVTRSCELPFSCLPWGGRCTQARLSEDFAEARLRQLNFCSTHGHVSEHWPGC